MAALQTPADDMGRRKDPGLADLLRQTASAYVGRELKRCGINASPPPTRRPQIEGDQPSRWRRGAATLRRLAPKPGPSRQAADPRNDPAVVRARLAQSTDGLRIWNPQQSAFRTLDQRQQRGFAAVAVLLVLALAVAPHLTLLALVSMATALYLAILGYRLLLFRASLQSPALVAISDDEARAIPDHELPTYSVLVPAYREPEVVGKVLTSLAALEYPRDRLDIKLILEADDEETLTAVREAAPDVEVDLVIVPAADPRTKPKALNYALQVARGEMVTVYDVEDRPEPLQLRRAVAAFRHVDPSVACLQAKLSYHNVHQNLITKWFTIEYGMWFSLMLPGLVAQQAPLPLSGTSNHFRRKVLDELNAWDPHNVTEDADLGIRLHRHGWKVGVLDSTTYEEANSDFINWVKQRSRWYKGYFQTWLVHMRHPRRLLGELGLRGFVGFNLFVGGTPILALVNPVFWVLTLLWFVGRPTFVAELFPAWLYYTSLLTWLGGNFLFAYANMLSAHEIGKGELVKAAVVSPLYWVMMSVAAVKAAIQLVHKPSYWEKTQHGLDMAPVPITEAVTSAA